jgi:hypothetical protein
MNESVKMKAFEVNDLLSEYVVLHNHLIKSAGTFSSLFKKVDFGSLTEQTQLLYDKFLQKDEEIKKWSKQDFNKAGREFVNYLCQYVDALTNTAKLLLQMYQYLRGRAEEGKKITFSAHMENDRKYQESIQEYLKIGKHLNDLYPLL